MEAKKEKKKRKWPKILGITLLCLVLLIGALGVGGYFYLRSRFGGTPAANLAPASGTEVDIAGGRISGGLDGGVYTYLGVPYAHAEEMFVRAQPVEPWSGVREYTEYGAMSPQSSFFGSDGQDNNCQNLNLWTPALNDGGKRPVMVWLHGGGFSSGSANEAQTNGRNLAEKEDVVVVTVNHRLGAAGYLNLSAYGEKYAYSANVGMWDVIDALQWIHDNIEAFGGDPDNVTVFGQSGGGAKVMTLMATPYAKGLFHKGIIQSGTTETVGPVLTSQEVSLRITELVLADLGLDETNIKNIQSMPFSQIDAAGTRALQQVANEYQIESPFGGSYSYEWEPVVDGDFLPTNPVTEDGFAEAGRDIPILIGSNLNEWAMMTGGFGLEANMSEADVLSRLQSTYGESAKAVLDAFKAAYPNEAPVNALAVDAMLRVPLLRTMAHKADQGGAPVYAYIFTYGAPSCFHGAEIPYAFANGEAGPINDMMSAIWANFARTGAPSIDDLPDWPAYTRAEGATMILNTDSYVANNHDLALLELLKPGFEY